MSNTDQFTATVSEFPEVTRVQVTFCKPRKFAFEDTEPLEEMIVEIPTAEVFQEGDFVSRRLAGVKHGLIQTWLDQSGHTRAGLERWVRVLKD